ncbi:hypothetical protein DL770_004921 [Monosporascus sp. CRB-9-2]|nr:hypothetical protein DL770_004921 [Monosporascus sp. CRB-9-2]
MEDSFTTGKSDHIELLQDSQSTLGVRDGLIQDSMSRLSAVTLEPSRASFDDVKLAMQRLEDRNQATHSEKTEATTSDDPGLRGRRRKRPRVDDKSLEPTPEKGKNYHRRPKTSDIGINASLHLRPSVSLQTCNIQEPSHMASNTATTAGEEAGDELIDSVKHPTHNLRNVRRPDYKFLHKDKEPLGDYDVLLDRDSAIETARRCLSYMAYGNDSATPEHGPSEAETHAPQPDSHAEEATLPDSMSNISNDAGPIIQGFRPVNRGNMGFDPQFGCST